MLDISVFYCGLKLKNPIIVSSAGTTETFDHMKRCQEFGAGAVVMKSYFEKKEYRQDATPHFKIIRRKYGDFRCDTLYSSEQASKFDRDGYANEISRAKKHLEIPIIANIDCYDLTKSVEAAKIFAEAGADALEIKACPHGELSMSGKSYEQTMLSVLEGIKKDVNIPVIVKHVAQLSNPVASSLKLERGGVDGLVLFNRFAGLDIDINSETPIMHGGYAGHGGLWSIYYSIRWISALYPKVKIPICGSGGVYNGEDIIKYILSGATCVSICTSIILNGYEIIEKMKKELEKWMKQKNYNTINDFLGKAAERVKGIDEYKRGREVIASINQDICKSCGKCEKICFHQAINHLDKKFIINSNKCKGCGLCEQICPFGAIKMIKDI
ncbi:MAG: 4Fe-4S binding protein [Eubacteriaceae bacterium]